MVRGILTTEVPWDETLTNQNTDFPEDRSFAGHLTGVALGAQDFTEPFDHDIRIDVACVASWCGFVPRSSESIFLVERDSGGPFIVFGPCGSGEMQADVESLGLYLACHRGETCESDY